jgi:hypothetical protein
MLAVGPNRRPRSPPRLSRAARTLVAVWLRYLTGVQVALAIAYVPILVIGGVGMASPGEPAPFLRISLAIIAAASLLATGAIAVARWYRFGQRPLAGANVALHARPGIGLWAAWCAVAVAAPIVAAGSPRGVFGPVIVLGTLAVVAGIGTAIVVAIRFLDAQARRENGA